MKHTAQKHLLIGGPGTGKSTTLQLLQDMGYNCFPEIAREITLSAKKNGVDQLYLADPLAFSIALLKGRIEQFEKANRIEENVVFMDRGIPDISAYLDYSKQQYPPYFTDANKKHRYQKVFHFPIWKEIFTSDNERYENLEEAVKIDLHLQKTYTALGYELIQIPKSTVYERVNFILQHQNQ